jgi:hypothetical protein
MLTGFGHGRLDLRWGGTPTAQPGARGILNVSGAQDLPTPGANSKEDSFE